MLKFLFIVLVTLFALHAFADDDVDDPDVVVLDTENFEDFVKGDTVLVEFYAPWCGHCKNLAPEYQIAAKTLAANDPPVRLGKVDATIHGELASRFDVKGYPTLKVFRNGEASAYMGPRKADGIVSYMRSQAGPAAKPLASADALAKFRAEEPADVVVVGFFAGSEHGDALAAFKRQADQLREQYRFGVVTDAALVKEANGGQDGTVVVLRPAAWKGEEERVQASADDAADLAAWLPGAATPLAGLMTKDMVARYDALGLPRLSLYAPLNPTRDPAGVRYFNNRLRKAARDFVGRMAFVSVDTSDGQGAREFSEFAFGGDQKFSLGIVDARGKKYKGPEGLSTADPKELVKFAQQFFDGKLAPYVKSEPVPEINDGPVTTVVGSTFDELVLDSDANVFLEVYAPWCGHCKALTPKWEELGKKYDGDSNVVIAKIDGTANDLPKNIEVRGFPTLLFFKAGEKNAPKSYDGAREVADMAKFIKVNAGKSGTSKDEL